MLGAVSPTMRFGPTFESRIFGNRAEGFIVHTVEFEPCGSY